MNVAAASASATLTADEIVVGTALGGQKYVLGGFSKAINLGTTGAGGMDTGSAPVSGFVGIYAIYNPTTGASALLATNATAARVPEVYGGSNMPSGYTASALVSVAPTSGSGQFTALTQRDRSVAVVNRPIISTSSGSSTPQPYTTTVFPKNAVRVKGYSSFTTGAASTVNAGIYADAAGSDQSTVGGTFTGAQGIAGSFDVLISQPQTIYYTLTSSSGAPSWGANCERYDF
ncbi:TPA: phage tail protein [Burkholderia vietnamiensis]|nr:phage tail protein [Burkholderia vietnamiensis]